jgi:hypothetical protein
LGFCIHHYYNVEGQRCRICKESADNYFRTHGEYPRWDRDHAVAGLVCARCLSDQVAGRCSICGLSVCSRDSTVCERCHQFVCTAHMDFAHCLSGKEWGHGYTPPQERMQEFHRMCDSCRKSLVRRCSTLRLWRYGVLIAALLGLVCWLVSKLR